MSTSLSEQSKKVIDAYLHLDFGNATVSTPYFNNRRSKLRGALRALIGKGSPQDIVEEARIIALKEKIDLSSLDEEKLKQFLVDHNLGVDCSGFVYHVMNAQTGGKMKSLHKQFKNPIKKLFPKFRAAETTGVKVLADKKNSQTISLNEVRPGDMIIMLESGEKNDRDHVLLIHEVQDNTIHYSHSLQWRQDGKYHHGVRQGTITITNPNTSFLEQDWIEQGKTGDENGTLEHAKQAKTLELRRLLCVQ